MDSLSDYVRWMKDFPISMTGFRDEDALVLCALSYIDLSPMFSSGSECPTVRDCRKMMENGKLRVMITGRDKGFSELLDCAAGSKRFGDLRISDYMDTVRQDPPLQFSAMCFHDDTDFSFIAFRGTDSSLAGWKENFMISFTCTEAQELALHYAEEHIVPGRHWRIGGHSKGGNLALYASCLMTDQKWSCVDHLYLFASPGICPQVLDLSLQNRTDPKTTRVVPAFCMIGKLFEPKVTDTRIVQSSASGFGQHLLISWGIDHDRLALAKEQEPESLYISKIVNDWIGGISQADRVVFTDDLFHALAAGGADTIGSILDGGLEGLEAIVRQLNESSEITKNTLNDLPKYSWKFQMDALKRKLTAGREGKSE